jgi:hypothetical protein
MTFIDYIAIGFLITSFVAVAATLSVRAHP